ncbi:serine/arginine repetitive matrix protein 2-like [Littorina saxatilis]|uniref:U1-type domain-containing protein n=1 Tax=Littorina saxatilis TaxID=31220 RepID=A0AAN9BJI4_9CAEN
MVYRGRGNPRARGFTRPFHARGRSRRPFQHHGQNRGFGRGGPPSDEGLRITLRNPGRDRRDDEEYNYGQGSQTYDREPGRRGSYDDYEDKYGGEPSHGYEQEPASFDEQQGSPKRGQLESAVPEDESLRITVAKNRFDEQAPEGRWRDEGREDRRFDSRGAEDDRGRFRDQEGRNDWEERSPQANRDDNLRGRGRGHFDRNYDPIYRGRGIGDFRGRGRGNYEYNERGRGRGFYNTFDRGRGRGGYDQGRLSLDDDFDRSSQRRLSISPIRRRSRSRDRLSRSPDRRRSRSRSRGRSRRRSYSRERRSLSRGRRSRSYDRRSRSRSRSGSRRSFSRSDSRNRSPVRRSRSPSPFRKAPSRNRSPSPLARALSRNRSPSPLARALSRNRSPSPTQMRRALSRSRIPSPLRRAQSRNRSPSPMRRALSRPKSMGRELGPVAPVMADGSPRRSPIRSKSQGPGEMRGRSQSRGRELRSQSRGRDLRSQSRGRDQRSQSRSKSQGRDRRSQSRGRTSRSQSRARSRHSRSSSSSSSSSTDSRSRSSQPELSEQQYEEEMYRRLKTELSANKDPKDREERIAKHIREMAKLSPALFRQFMAKNAGNLSAMALMQSEPPDQSVEADPNQLIETDANGRPLRSILKRQGESPPPPERSPTPPPPEPPSGLSQIEKVIQALRKGGTKQEEKKPVKEGSTPVPTGALRNLSSYMDIEEEEEFLYGGGPRRREPPPERPPGPFWAMGQVGEQPPRGTGAFGQFGPSHQTVNLAPNVDLDLPSSQPSETGLPPKKHPFDMFEELTSKKVEPVKIPSAFGSFEEKEKSYEQWRASVFKKQTPEKPKEPTLPPSTSIEGKETAEQLSATVENILKSIGFNFELSQRMQELAKQKKEDESQQGIMIDQSASFLGSDALTENLTSVFKKDRKPEEHEVTNFMKEIEAATRLAKEKAAKAREAEKRHVRGRTPAADNEGSRHVRGRTPAADNEGSRHVRGRTPAADNEGSRHIRGRTPGADNEFSRGRDRSKDHHSHRESDDHRDRSEREGGAMHEQPKRTRRDSVGGGALSRFDIPTSSVHSPYDPSVPDYTHTQPYHPHSRPQSGYDDIDDHLYGGMDFEDAHQSKPVRTSNLISLGGDSSGHERTVVEREGSGRIRSKSFSETKLKDFDRPDRDMEDVSHKKSGERILIVKKKEDKSRIDSPGSDNSFSRRIILPPREKGKLDRTPESESRRDGKRRAGSPVSPRQSKQSRRSPSVEDRPTERIVFQKSKSSKQPEPQKAESYRKEKNKSPTPEKVSFDSRYKFQIARASSQKTDPRTEREISKTSSNKLDLMKAKIKAELPKPGALADKIKAEVERAAKIAQDKARLLERKKKILALDSELEALRNQYNEMLRKRRRQKDGHKDPLLAENSKLQDEISAQLRALRDGKDVPFGAPLASQQPKASAESSSSKTAASKSANVDKKAEEEKVKVHFEYFDPGTHWCSTCNVMCGHMFDFFKHLETKKHQQKLDPFNRPWLVEAMQKAEKKPKPQGPVQAHPIKGLEFMQATAAFYCSLCSQFCGDLSIAETHIKSEEHNDKYRDYLSQHPYYEKRYMLERSAALATQKHFTPEEEEEKSNGSDSDSEKKSSDASKKKKSTKSNDKESPKEKKGKDWKEKIYRSKTMYSDYEEDSKSKSDSKEKDKDSRRSRGGSRERGKSSRDRWDNKERENSRGSKESQDRKDSKESSKKDAKENGKSEKTLSKLPVQETVPESKKEELPAQDAKAEDKSKSVSEESTAEKTPQESQEETKKEGKTKPEEAKKREESGNPEAEADAKGKIPIKLTGKSGIKPATTTLPPWKVFTRPIPKLTMQKRLLASRPQQVAATGAKGPALPNEDPVPLEDFLTLGSKKKTPVPVMPDVPEIPQPPDPKSAKKTEEDQQKWEEMMLLGIDPSSLMPDVTPRPPPPPSQNLSMPPGMVVQGASSSEIASAERKDLSSSDSDSSPVKPKDNTASSSNTEEDVPWKRKKGENDSNSDSDSDKGKPKDAESASSVSMDLDEMEEVKTVTPLPPSFMPEPQTPVPHSHPTAVVPPLPPAPPVNVALPPAPPVHQTLLPTPDFTVPPPGFFPMMLDTSFPPPNFAPLPPYAPPPLPADAPPPPPPPPDGAGKKQAYPAIKKPVINVTPIPDPKPKAGTSKRPIKPGMPQTSVKTTGAKTPTSAGAKATSSGAQATTAGAPATSAGAQATSAGAKATPAGAKATSSGAHATTAGAQATSAGAKATSAGAKAPLAGAKATSSGAKAPSAGAKATSAGAKAPSAGAKATSSGAKATSAGAKAPSAGAKATSSGAQATTAGAQATSAGAKATSAGAKATSAGSNQSPAATKTVTAQGQSKPAVTGAAKSKAAAKNVKKPPQGSPAKAKLQQAPVKASSNPKTENLESGAGESTAAETVVSDLSSVAVIENPEPGPALELQPSTSTSEVVSQEVVPATEGQAATAEVSPVTSTQASPVVSTQAAADTSTQAASATSTQAASATSTQAASATSTQAASATSTQAASATSTQAASATSTQAATSPTKKQTAAQRVKAARKVSPAPLAEASSAEPAQEEEAGDEPTPKRRKTRSQTRTQPLRQTRSRTRQKRTGDEPDVTASDEGNLLQCEGEAASSTAQEAETGNGSKASSTSACVLDLTSPPADSSVGSEANTEVTSSSSDMKSCGAAKMSPPRVDSALNLTLTPEAREARQGRVEQTIPEDLSSYAEPQDLSTSSSSGKGKGRRALEMPIDLTMRLAPLQAAGSSSEEPPVLEEMQPSPSTSSQISSSEGAQRAEGALDPQTVKDTLLSCSSSLNPSTGALVDMDVSDEAGLVDTAPSQLADSAGLGVDPQGDLVDFSLAPMDFEGLVDMDVEDSAFAAAVPAPPPEGAEEDGGTADSTLD